MNKKSSQSGQERLQTILEQIERSDISPQQKLLLTDEGLALIQTPKNKKAETKLLLRKGNLLVQDRKFEEGLSVLKQALYCSTLTDDRATNAFCHLYLGSCYVQMGKAELFEKHTEEGLNLGRKIQNDSVLSLGFMNKAATYANMADYENAFQNFDQALQHLEKAPNPHYESICLTNIGRVLIQLGELENDPSRFEKAEYYLKRAIQLAKTNNNNLNLALCYNWAGISNTRTKQFQKGIEFLKKSLTLFDQEGQEKWVETLLNNLGVTYFENGKPETALEYFQKVIKKREANGNFYSSGPTYTNIGKILLAQGNLPLALRNLIKAEISYSSHSDPANEVICLSLLAEVYARAKKFEKAWQYQVKYSDLRIKLINENNSKTVADVEVKYETKRKETEKEIFRLRNVELKNRNQVIREQKKKSEELLHNILPKEVAGELKRKGSVRAKRFESVSVLFTDFQGFTQLASKLPPSELVTIIHHCFSAFDEIAAANGLEKIKTIGDSYMAAGGLPIPNNTHPENVVRAALAMLDFMEKRNASLQNTNPEKILGIRIGIHTGPVVAGVVGSQKFQYDIWGDTVNTASRMESSGEPGKINISETTFHMVRHIFSCTHRGEIEAKGKGKIKMYFVNR